MNKYELVTVRWKKGDVFPALTLSSSDCVWRLNWFKLISASISLTTDLFPPPPLE